MLTPSEYEHRTKIFINQSQLRDLQQLAREEAQSTMSPDLKKYDLTVEAWREYDWTVDGVNRVYRIENPAELYIREGGLTHRVVDEHGIAHCLPSPGRFGCVLRWLDKDPAEPVKF
jgi:hypothetical protein